jgi:hypothetical protein
VAADSTAAVSGAAQANGANTAAAIRLTTVGFIRAIISVPLFLLS